MAADCLAIKFLHVFQIASHVLMLMNVYRILAVLKTEYSKVEMILNVGKDSMILLHYNASYTRLADKCFKSIKKEYSWFI